MILNKTGQRKAFTLIELLVVIMIIMLLAGMIMPAIKSARERSRDVLCKNNLKQLQVAALSVAIEGDGTLPYSKSQERWDWKCPHNKSRTWMKDHTGWIDWFNYTCDVVENRDRNDGYRRPGEVRWWGPRGLECITNGTLWTRVGESTKVYACPEWLRDTVCGKKDAMGGNLTFSTTNNFPWRSYFMNRSVSHANIGDIEASKRILFAEMSMTNFLDGVQMSDRCALKNYSGKQSRYEWDAWDGDFHCVAVNNKTYPYENIGLHHRGKGNVVFADGHIEQLTWQVTTNAAKGNW